ncbi:MAG: glycosyl transferase, partial [Acidobacteriota bacterium]
MGSQGAHFVITIYKFALIVSSCCRNPQIAVPAERIAALTDDELPVYTILVPLYKEANVAGSILHSLELLDYP